MDPTWVEEGQREKRLNSMRDVGLGPGGGDVLSGPTLGGRPGTHVTPRPASQDPEKLGESLGRKLGSVGVWTAGEAV